MTAVSPDRNVRHPGGLPAELAGLDRCLVMGVVNVTPDSFSDGGQWFEPVDAIARGFALAADGADILDVGGESTRPGARRTPLEEELRRVLPVVEALADAGIAVSIDTTRAEVADAALACGAVLVNDVSGGLADPAMADLVADARVPFVAMHWRGQSDRMEQLAVYGDVVAAVGARPARPPGRGCRRRRRRRGRRGGARAPGRGAGRLRGERRPRRAGPRFRLR